MGGYCVQKQPRGSQLSLPGQSLAPKSDALWDILKGKLGNGEHLFLEAYKDKENYIHMIYIIIIM